MSFQVTEYPDGQVSLYIDRFESHVKIRINSYKDLFLLKSFSDIHRFNNWLPPTVFIPCLFGQQSDRRFFTGSSFDLKNICEFINSCEFPRVQILDPHSDIGPALINNSVVKTSEQFVKLSLEQLEQDVILVSPDAGAYKKVYKYAENLSKELVAANKFRDKNGDIFLNFMGDVRDKNCLIVDDISLGGRTFIELAKKLKEQGASKVYLYVTHGRFTKGFEELYKYIDKIFCTNSVCDFEENDRLTQFKVI